MFNGAVPPFDLADGGFLLVLARCLVVTASFSAFGTLVFRAFALPKVFEREAAELIDKVEARLKWIEWSSLATVIVALVVWLIFESIEMAGADDISSSLAAIPNVLFHTSFGAAIALQLIVFIAACLILNPIFGWAGGLTRLYTATAATGLGVILQAGHSHALAMNGFSLLLVSVFIHLLAGGAWLGGLLPLLCAVATMPPKAGALACRYFSSYGKICVVGIALTAAYQGWVLTGGLAGLAGSAYGYMALTKLGLYLVLLGFAALHRYRLAPALLQWDTSADTEIAKRVLLRSLAVQTAFGLAVVFAAATLSSLPPGMHTQPVWPFAERFSLDTINEDPEFRSEVIEALAALGAAGLFVALGFAVRRLRWLAVALALMIAWFAVPHLSLLLVDAYPTSFYHSPTGFSTTSIVEGYTLFQQECTACHGAEGRGDGPLAKTLSVPPADLTAGHLWMHSDGELFWWLTHGIDAPESGLAMPGFAATLTEDQRWNLIDYIRANNAGRVFAAQQSWAPALMAPRFTYACGGGQTLSSDALRGSAVRLVFAGAGTAALPDVAAATGVSLNTIVVPRQGRGGEIPPSQKNVCVASGPALRAAFAVTAGLPTDALAGSQFLIDPNGWLRAMQRPGSLPFGAKSWEDRGALLAAVQQICTHPLARQASMHGHHL